jgi:4-hydroxybenzoate polyprenyltransferase
MAFANEERRTDGTRADRPYDQTMGVDSRADLLDKPVIGSARALLAALRPHQWTKNLLVFAGIVFAGKIDDPHRWVEAVACFVAYCVASSAAYLVNDVRDLEADRLHPVKRSRPIAAGLVAVRTAMWTAVALFALALGITASLGPVSVALLVAFGALQVGYSAGLKHVAVLDVLVISTLFVIRAAAGAEAVDVTVSPWLLLCTGLLASFLALGKRQGELALVQAGGTPGRRVLEGYTAAAIEQLMTISAAATIAAYALYTFTARDSDALMITIPYVIFGVFRYILLLQRGLAGEEPERVLVTDVPILAAMLAWVVTCAAVLAFD